MDKQDIKRLLRAWLEPKNKRRILSHAKRYAKVFGTASRKTSSRTPG